MLCRRGIVSRLSSISMYRVWKLVLALWTPGRGALANDLIEASRFGPRTLGRLLLDGVALLYWSWACDALRWTGLEIWRRGSWYFTDVWRTGSVSAFEGWRLTFPGRFGLSEDPPVVGFSPTMPVVDLSITFSSIYTFEYGHRTE